MKKTSKTYQSNTMDGPRVNRTQQANCIKDIYEEIGESYSLKGCLTTLKNNC